jgi:hypothetical protein
MGLYRRFSWWLLFLELRKFSANETVIMVGAVAGKSETTNPLSTLPDTEQLLTH